MLVRTAFPSLTLIPDRAAVLVQLRGLLARQAGWREDVNAALPFGLAALDSHLPNGGLACGALHEIVPTTQAALPAAFGFVVAILARLSSSYGAGLADGERTDAGEDLGVGDPGACGVDVDEAPSGAPACVTGVVARHASQAGHGLAMPIRGCH